MRGWVRSLRGGGARRAPLPQFTVADGAPDPTACAVHRACLAAVRGRLDDLWVDLSAFEGWPDDARAAAYRLSGDRRHTVGVDVGDDDGFADAVRVCPFSLSVDGVGEGRLVYSAGDDGTGLVVELAAREHRAAEAELRDGGHDPRWLVHLPR